MQSSLFPHFTRDQLAMSETRTRGKMIGCCYTRKGTRN